jgi:hypothetical protein
VGMLILASFEVRPLPLTLMYNSTSYHRAPRSLAMLVRGAHSTSRAA